MAPGWPPETRRAQRPARCYSAYPRTVTLQNAPLRNRCSNVRTTRGGWALLVGRTLPVVERLPIVVAIRFIADPGLEIGLLGMRVVVLVVGAVIPVVPRVRLAVWGLPLVVDMDPVPVLAVESLLLVFLVVLVAPRILRGLRLAVVGAIRFAVLEVTIWVVVLGVLIAVMRSTLVGQDRRSHEHHRRQQPQKQHQPSQLILLSKASPYHFPRMRAKNLLSTWAVPQGSPATLHHGHNYDRLPQVSHHANGLFFLELARVGSLIFVFSGSVSYQVGSSSLFDTFATRLFAQPLTSLSSCQCN